MFKILVVSDTHGKTDLLHCVVSANRTCDLVIHLGDHCTDGDEVMRDFSAMAYLCVSGNCDMFSFLNKTNTEGCFTAEKRRIFYTHGHKYNVKYGTEYLVSQAKINNAQIALFGHTHISSVEEKNGVLVINPGSLACPRDGTGGTYCVLEIKEEKVKYEIKEVTL